MARPKNSNPKLAIAYLRVSTDADRQALGLEAQRHAIETWAQREGVSIAAWYTEEISGGAPIDQRLVLLEALAAVGAHEAGLLVVQRLDRFSREPISAALAMAELQRHGATLATADGIGAGDDPASELVRTIMFGVAKFEKAMTRARIRAALAGKKRRGELTGTAPYGMRSEAGCLVPEPSEQAVIVQIRHLASDEGGALSVRRIASELASRGVVGRTGRPLSHTQVHRVLSSAPLAA